MEKFEFLSFLWAVRDNGSLSSSAKAVAVVSLLARRNSSTGSCMPGIECIKADAGFKDERSVHKALKELEAAGIVLIERAKGKPNNYVLIAGQQLPTKNVGTSDVVPAKNVPTKNASQVPTKNAGQVPTKNEGLSSKGRSKGSRDSVARRLDLDSLPYVPTQEVATCDVPTCHVPTSDVGRVPTCDAGTPPTWDVGQINQRNKPKNKKEEKAHRLDVETLPFEWFVDCVDLQPELDAYKLFDEFCDYWMNVEGKKGMKLDWRRTWKNYLRNLPTWKHANFAREGGLVWDGKPWRRPVDPDSSLGRYYAMQEDAIKQSKAEDELLAYAETRLKNFGLINHDPF